MTVYPTGDEFPEVAGDVEAVWESVLDSFTFLGDAVLAQFDACPDEASPYVDVAVGYCLRYPSQFQLANGMNPDGVTLFDSPFAASHDQEAVTVTLTIEVVDAAQGRDLQELVDEIVVGYPEAEIGQGPAELGGETAIVVEGLPNPEESRQLFVLHNDQVVRLELSPLDDVPEVSEAAERVWEAVTNSFTFLPPDH